MQMYLNEGLRGLYKGAGPSVLKVLQSLLLHALLQGNQSTPFCFASVAYVDRMIAVLALQTVRAAGCCYVCSVRACSPGAQVSTREEAEGAGEAGEALEALAGRVTTDAFCTSGARNRDLAGFEFCTTRIVLNSGKSVSMQSQCTQYSGKDLGHHLQSMFRD